MKKNIILVISLIAFTISNAFAQDVAKGEKLYNGLCLPCHAIDKKIVGPALNNIQKIRDEKWLIAFIANSTEFAKKDAEAAAVIKEYNGMMMPAQPQLSNADIKDILAYIASKSVDEVKASEKAAAPVASVSASDVDQMQEQNQRGLVWSLIFGIGAFVVIALVLVERIKISNYPPK